MEKSKQPKVLERAKGIWKGLNKALQISVISVSAVLLVVIIYLLAIAGRVEYEVLQTGLAPSEAANVTSILGDLGVDYKVEGVNNVTVYVQKGTRAQVLLQLQNEGYPASGEDLYNLYINEAMGMGSTDQDRRVIEEYTLEQRLTYLIEQLDKIKDAHVVLNLPQESQFAISGNERPSQASVILTLEPGVDKLTAGEAEVIRSTVLTAVPGLLAENVTITDTSLNRYDVVDATGMDSVYAADQISLKEQHQRLIEEQVHNFLDPVFGAGNVVVTATVELDFDKKSTQTVTYSPPGNEDNMGIIVSLQQSAERGGVTEMAEGVAGFDANGAAPFYPEDLEGDAANTYYYSQQLNAEVNEVREQIEQAQGKVTDMNVSIMIDGDEALDDELENIRGLVANGLGIGPEYVSIMRRSFESNQAYEQMLAEQAEAELAREEDARSRRILLIALAAALALAIVVVLLVMRSRRKRAAYEAELAAIEAAQLEEAQRALEEMSARDMLSQPEDGGVAASQLKVIQDLANDNPEMVAQMLRNWLADEFGSF